MGQKFYCTECVHEAAQKVNLTRHLKSANRELIFQCPQCDHEATQNANLATHVAQQRKEWNYYLQLILVSISVHRVIIKQLGMVILLHI